MGACIKLQNKREQLDTYSMSTFQQRTYGDSGFSPSTYIPISYPLNKDDEPLSKINMFPDEQSLYEISVSLSFG